MQCAAVGLLSIVSACGGGGSSSKASTPAPTTFALGGTVAGLAPQAQLLLLSGAGTQATIKANGNFEFPDRLKAGTPYRVTVNKQPVGQTCSVEFPSGTVPTPGADVRNLTIVCTNNPYQLSGSVAGLGNGLSLTLGDGGPDESTVTVTANGRFVFPARFAQGSKYGVTVLAAPYGQDCKIIAGTGAFATASISTVDVVCTAVTSKIGGSMAGLAAGQEVVLSNNAGERLTVTANGSFQFAELAAFGSSYAVAIVTQPATQVCAVSDGAGRNVMADVTSVRVTCAGRSYSVGGAVVGLSSTTTSNLTLANNGQDVIRIGAAGVFMFPTPLPSGASYSITVTGQPQGQTCIVMGGAGKVEQADVRSISVQCTAGAWRSRLLAGSGVGRTTDGVGSSAELWAPSGSVVLPSGAMLVAEISGSVLRRVQLSTGQVSTYAGSLLPGYLDSSVSRAASFRAPHGIAVDRNGHVFIADAGNHVIRRIDAFTGAVSTWAGTGQSGAQDGPGTSARFNSPQGIAVDPSGFIYVADTGNHAIRRISPDQVVTTVVGALGMPGLAGGVGADARFMGPAGLVLDASGRVFVSDSLNGAIRMIILATGEVTTLAGQGTQGDADGTGPGARLSNPTALAWDGQGTLYIADSGNHKVRTLQIINGAGVVQTLAGTGLPGDAEGENLGISLRQPYGLSLTQAGELVVSEAGGHRLRLLARTVAR